MHPKSIKSPWLSTFKTFVSEANRELFLVSPYIGRWPLEIVAQIIQPKQFERIELVTDFSLNSLQSGSLDANALVDFVKTVPTVKITHLPRLHAKIYLSEKSAITTSANLTANGLLHNYEYGTQLNDIQQVIQIKVDLLAYLETGSAINHIMLGQVAGCVDRIKKTAIEYERTKIGKATLRAALTENQEDFAVQILTARTETESVESIFRRTILYIMSKNEELTTQQLHQYVQNLQPDLCDDSTDRIINSIHFGKKWKHQVRTAQAGLQRRGLIKLVGKTWKLLP